ncbi:MAG: hypothetical protein KIT31_35970 [Deltaproteobacteria bacterium]|nr:hypothetical protein [Deltaproteobacteria bacterium]
MQPPTGEPLTAEWTAFRQGRTPIDEQDFYAIAGDHESRDTIAYKRERGILFNRVGIALALVGLGGLIGGATVDNKLYGGAIFLPIGGVMGYWGKLTAEKRPQLSIHHARQVADRYNASLGMRGGL